MLLNFSIDNRFSVIIETPPTVKVTVKFVLKILFTNFQKYRKIQSDTV